MPELPEVTQEFTADVDPYLEGIAAMIEATQKFAEEVNNAISDVDALNAAIRALPDEKTIHINVDTTGMPEAAAAAAGAEGAAPDTAGMAAEAAAEDAVGDAADEADAKVRLLSEAEDANAAAALRDAAAQEALRAAAEDTGTGFQRAGENTNSLEESFAQLDDLLRNQGGDWEEVDLGAGRAAESLGEVAAATEGATEALGPAAESLDEVGLSYREMVEQGILPADSALRDAASSFAAADDAAVTDAEHLGAVGDAAEAATVPFTALGLAARDATEPFAAVGDATRDVGAELENLRNDAADTDAAFGMLGSAATGIVNGFAGVEETWKNTNVVWGLSLNALHWIVMGSMELLAVAVPAMVAFGAAADVGLQGAVETGQRLESVYTVTESLGGAFNTTGGEAIGLKGNLQAAQDAADPQIWELLGEGIKAVGEESGSFVQMGTQVIGILDRFGAEIDDDLNPALNSMGGQLNSVIGKGVQDLTMFGQVLGNLGHFILNLATDMPGLAEVLLGTVAGFTKLLEVLTQPAWYNFGGSLVTIGMGIEEAWRWGGLLAPVLAKASSGLSSLALNAATGLEGLSGLGRGAEESEEALTGWRAAAAGAGEGALGLAGGLETAAGVLTGPWGWVILGATAGLALLIIKLNDVKSAAQQMVSGMEQAINSASFTQGFANATNSLDKLQQKYTQTSDAAAAAGQKVNVSDDAYGRAASVMNTAAGAASTYSEGITQVAGKSAAIITAGSEISSKFGVSVPAAFALADNAGLKVGTSISNTGKLSQTALTQIQGLIAGYQVMSGNSSALGNNINAVNYQLGLQGSQVQKLNSAWDNFMSVVTGGTAAWASLSDDLQQLGNTANVAGGKIQAFTGTSVQGMQQIGQSLKSFGGTSAQVWQNFDAALTQANTVTDWWRTAAASGAASGKQLTEAIATTTAQFVPYVGSSKTALAETMALAQEAGGPAYNASKSLAQNYQTLKTWVDKNSVSQSQYNSLLGVATTQLSNVSQAAQQFSQTLQSDVAQAVAAGSVNLNQVTQDTKNFTTALQHNQPQSKAVTTDIDQMAGQFYHSGMSAQSAGSLIYQLGINQGLTRAQASWLENEMVQVMKGMQNAGSAAHSAGGNMSTAAGDFHNAANQAYNLAQQIDGIHSKTVTVGVDYVAYGAIPGGASNNIQAGLISGTSGYTGATGMLVPGGYGGGDTVPAMLEPGETVVPKHLTSAVAPLMRANHVPGFAGGGIMGSDGGYGSFGGGGDNRPIHVHVEMNGTQVASALIPSLTSANGKYAVRNSGKATGVWKPV